LREKEYNNKIVNEIEYKDLMKLYPVLGQVLDGLWFLEVEKNFGFDKALEIDSAVWEIYSKNETKRLLKLLLKNPEDRFKLSDKELIDLLEQILKLSLFNQSVEYVIERISENKGLILKVYDCKTLRGMKKVGRNLKQVESICRDIGLVYYENMAKEFHPKLKVECLSIPKSFENIGNSVLCSWKLYFQE